LEERLQFKGTFLIIGIFKIKWKSLISFYIIMFQAQVLLSKYLVMPFNLTTVNKNVRVYKYV